MPLGSPPALPPQPFASQGPPLQVTDPLASSIHTCLHAHHPVLLYSCLSPALLPALPSTCPANSPQQLASLPYIGLAVTRQSDSTAAQPPEGRQVLPDQKHTDPTERQCTCPIQPATWPLCRLGHLQCQGAGPFQIIMYQRLC